MNIESFTEMKTGQLVPLGATPKAGWAFVPGPLPGNWTIPEGLWPLVTEARDAVARLEQIQAFLPNPMLLLNPLQRREALSSSSLEGTYATAAELLLFEIDQHARGAKPARTERKDDSREVWNYCEALRQGNNWLKEGERLDESLILRLHEVLMTGVRGKDKNPGQFRDCQVYIGRSTRRFVPPPPESLSQCLSQLTEYLSDNKKLSPDPLVNAYMVHYQFEAIHPFVDGNGRVGRVLLSLCVGQWIPLGLPWLYMSEFFERSKEEYIKSLYQVSANGEWDEWITFCLNGTIETARNAVERCNRLRKVRDALSAKAAGLGARMHDIIDRLFEYPVIRTTDVRDRFGVSYETASVDMKKLVSAGILKQIEKSYPRAFAAPSILAVAYDESVE